MAKTTDQLAASKAGSSAEQNGFGAQERPLRPGGVYELRDEDKNLVDTTIVQTHPLFGDSQAAAFERVGYKYVRPADKDEVKTLEIAPQQQATNQSSDEEIKGIMARLSAVEKASKEKDDVIAGLRADRESDNSGDSIKEISMREAHDEAHRQVAAREEGANTATASEGTKTGSSDVVPAENDSSTSDLGTSKSNAKKESK